MQLRDMILNLGNINAKNVPNGMCQCVDARQITDRKTGEITGQVYTCAGSKGSSYPMKVMDTSASSRETFNEVQSILRKEGQVVLEPADVVIYPYAFPTEDGHMLSGVSVKASSVSIIRDE